MQPLNFLLLFSDLLLPLTFPYAAFVDGRLFGIDDDALVRHHLLEGRQGSFAGRDVLDPLGWARHSAELHHDFALHCPARRFEFVQFVEHTAGDLDLGNLGVVVAVVHRRRDTRGQHQ